MARGPSFPASHNGGDVEFDERATHPLFDFVADGTDGVDGLACRVRQFPDMSAPVCCSPVAAGPLDDDAALEIACRLKALADPVRVKRVSLLFSSDEGEVCNGDLATAVGLSESSVSNHLSQLRRAGLVG